MSQNTGFFLVRWFRGLLALFGRLFGASSSAPSLPQDFDSKLEAGMDKSRRGFFNRLATLVGASKTIDRDLLDEIETTLLTADVGVDATRKIIDELTEALSRKELKDSATLWARIRNSLLEILENSETPLTLPAEGAEPKPFVILMVGVNGVGKTTTIGKLAKRFQNEGKSVMLAAGDTFRAAAVEQLKTWGERNDVPVVSQGTGADSASVIFDALSSAKAKGIDVILADTAGRLHTADNLMNELAKIRRVVQKFDPSAPHETLLVVDSVTGQNALNQAVEFNETAKLSGVVVTKLDGTAKGGVVFAIAKRLGLPIRFIGVGEGIDDLGEFKPAAFVDALLGKVSTETVE
ncbi:MAG: signal recognition particle-docking protein FtsY [Gammaproteobacteria bacterium]|nr:signal recognition particle-docking protein FtsY [Gammaproteobacteria bacterium]